MFATLGFFCRDVVTDVQIVIELLDNDHPRCDATASTNAAYASIGIVALLPVFQSLVDVLEKNLVGWRLGLPLNFTCTRMLCSVWKGASKDGAKRTSKATSDAKLFEATLESTPQLFVQAGVVAAGLVEFDGVVVQSLALSVGGHCARHRAQAARDARPGQAVGPWGGPRRAGVRLLRGRQHLSRDRGLPDRRAARDGDRALCSARRGVDRARGGLPGAECRVRMAATTSPWHRDRPQDSLGCRPFNHVGGPGAFLSPPALHEPHGTPLAVRDVHGRRRGGVVGGWRRQRGSRRRRRARRLRVGKSAALHRDGFGVPEVELKQPVRL